MPEKQFNDRQRLFCIEYLKDFNATQAAIRAGYSKKTAQQMGSENLAKPVIQQEISIQVKEMLAKAKIPLEKQIFDYWLKRAMYDVTEIIDLHGNLKITEEHLREKGLHVCIDGIEQRINAKGETYIKYKFADKDKAVEMLQRYIGMIKEEPQINITNNTQMVDLKAIILNQAKSPKDRERIISELEKLTGH